MPIAGGGSRRGEGGVATAAAAAAVVVVVVVFFLEGRKYYINTDSVCDKFFRHSIKLFHYHFICNCWLETVHT